MKEFCLCFGDEFMQELMPHIIEWRSKGVRVFTYPTTHKLKKQMQFANQSNAPWALFYGEEEQKKKVISLKNMIDGATEKISIDTIDASLFIK